MTQITQEDNELKRLLNNPAKNASEDGSMAPPLSVGYKNMLDFMCPSKVSFIDQRAETKHIAKCQSAIDDDSDNTS
jgi:hypothetical protein